MSRPTEAEIEWVPVAEEGMHPEQFRLAGARVYEAVMPAGATSDWHRHDRETLYVMTSGGRFRSEEAAETVRDAEVGRSVTLLQKLRILSGRALGGWMHMPTGMVFMQHTGKHPYVHRVRNGDDHPVSMLGVELDGSVTPPPAPPGLRPEYQDASVLVLRVGPDQLTAVPDIEGVAVVTSGTAVIGSSRLSTGQYAKVAEPHRIGMERGTELLLIYP